MEDLKSRGHERTMDTEEKPNLPANLLSIGDSIVNQLGVVGLLGSSQDQRGVGGGISGLVLSDG